MKAWSLPLGWGEMVRLTKDGNCIEVLVGEPGKNNHTTWISKSEARKLAKQLKKIASNI